MDQDIKNRWTAALRSGEYAQGRRALRSVNPDSGEIGYCCLGVLCELAVQDGIIEMAEGGYYDYERSVLPITVQQWAGVNGGNPPVTWNDREISLAELNDGYDPEGYDPLTFLQIADIIEDQL